MPTKSILEVTKTPRRRRRVVKSNHEPGESYENKENTHNTFFETNDYSFGKQNLSLLHFQFMECLKEIPVATEIWMKHAGLADYVLQTSVLSGIQDETYTSSLISTSRKLIKKVTSQLSTPNKGDQKTIFSSLFVALHSLRASATKSKMSLLETAIRLVYHLVTVAADAFAKTQDKQFCLIILTGYETLHHKLRSYSLSLNERMLSFSGPATADCVVLPMIHSSHPDDSSELGTMTLRQISTIVLRTSLETANAMQQLSQHTKKEQLGQSYGTYCHSILSQINDSNSEPIIELFEQSYLSWLIFLSQKSNDPECIKDVSNHSKLAHRFLWDAAVSSKQPRKSFQFRMHAILLLLQAKNHLGLCCTYAWKATTVFLQQSSGEIEAMSEFHQRVGAVLDDEVVKPIPWSYVEYATHRIRHTGIAPPSCILGGTSPQSIVLELLVLAISVQKSLEEGTDAESINNVSWESLARRFQSHVLSESIWNKDECGQCLKLWSTISLHRTLFHVLKQRDLQQQEGTLQLAVRLLTECVGPFLFLCLTRVPEKNMLPAFDMALESYIRPLSVLEKLGQDKFYESWSNHCMQELYQHILALPPSYSEMMQASLEKCAKSLSIVSRQRADQSNHAESILPQILSLQLYQRLPRKQQELQLRLHHLGAAYSQLEGKQYEACLALSLVLSLEANTTTSGQQLVSFVAAHSKQVFLGDNGNETNSSLIISTIRKVVTMSLEGMQPTKGVTPLKALVLPDALNVLLEREETNTVQQIWCISDVVESVLGGQRCSWDHKIKMMLELLVQMGSTISRQNTDISHLLVEYQTIVECLVESCRQQDIIPFPVLVSLVFLVASTSLLPFRIVYEDSLPGNPLNANGRTLELIRSYASQSLQVLEKEDEENEWQFVTSVIQISIIYYSLYVNTHDNDRTMLELFHQCQDAVTLLRTSPQTSLATQWMKWSLSNIQAYLEYQQDSVRATMVAFWILPLICNDQEEENWFGAVAISSYLNTKAFPYSMSIDDNFFNESSKESSKETSMSISWMAATEFRLCLSRLRKNDAHHYQSIEELQNETNFDRSNTDDSLLLWLQSTIELHEAQITQASGNLTQALKHAQACSSHCQTILSLRTSRVEEMPFWYHVAQSTLFRRANQRYATSLEIKARLYFQLGDYRRTQAYVQSLAKLLGLEISKGNKEERLRDCVSMLASSSASSFARLRAELECYAAPSDLVIQEFSSPERLCRNRDDDFELIRDLISTGDILYGDAIIPKFHFGFEEYYKEALRRGVTNNIVVPILPNYLKCNNDIFFTKFKLLKVRCLLEAKIGDVASEASSLCHQIIQDDSSSVIDRAWAFFYLGSLEMNEAQTSGALFDLWHTRTNNIEIESSGHSLQNARAYFLDAAMLIGASGNDVLHRAIFRSLALVTGPETGEISGESAGILILSSIGRSARKKMFQVILCKGNNTQDLLLEAFSCFDHSLDDQKKRGLRVRLFLHNLAKLVPSNWHFTAPTICISGQLLITSLEKSNIDDEFCVKTRCIFPTEKESGAYDDIVKPLDEIIMRSQQQLKGMDPSAVSEQFSKEAAKRSWWDARNRLDNDLRHLIEIVESQYFPTLHLSSDGNSIFDDGEACLPCGNLAMRFEAACDVSSPEEDTEEALKKLTVPKLKEKLGQFGFTDPQMRKLRKQEVIDRLMEEQEKKRRKLEEEQRSVPSGSKSCLFLLLDENLHRFPFEGMLTLEGKSVCRVPSLSFVYATLLERSLSKNKIAAVVDPSQTSFILDPENNLQATRKRLLPVLDSICTSRQWQWNGVTGEIPSSTFFKQALERENGLLIYIGHGGGQCCFSRRQVDQMIHRKESAETRLCKASVILMGCSSGRLVSVNRKNSDSLEELPLYFEPEGIALSYLCAGAPCVIGNMWDVTDHDIDRFSVALLNKFLGGEKDESSNNLASCVAAARGACKLGYIVGCAPVCYGVPVEIS